MKSHKLINGLSYVSVVFAPFIFPLIVWIVGPTEGGVMSNAKRAMILHLIPAIIGIAVFFLMGATAIATGQGAATGAISIPLLIIAAIVDVVLYIYSLVVGIKIWVTD